MVSTESAHEEKNLASLFFRAGGTRRNSPIGAECRWTNAADTGGARDARHYSPCEGGTAGHPVSSTSSWGCLCGEATECDGGHGLFRIGVATRGGL